MHHQEIHIRIWVIHLEVKALKLNDEKTGNNRVLQVQLTKNTAKVLTTKRRNERLEATRKLK